MPIRPAKLAEIGTFYTMWEEFLQNQIAVGGAQVNPKSIDHGGKLFQTYVSGSRAGSCHFWVDEDDTPQGFFLSGEPLSFFDTIDNLEDYWIIYGVYVREAFRGGSAGLEMCLEGAKVDMLKGAKFGVTVVKANNDRGLSLTERAGSTLMDMRYSFDMRNVIEKGGSNDGT